MFLDPASLSATAASAAVAADSKTGDIGPGLVTFSIVALLAIATFLLIRSMLNQIKKVPPTFDTPPSEGSVQDSPEAGTAHPDDQPHR